LTKNTKCFSSRSLGKPRKTSKNIKKTSKTKTRNLKNDRNSTFTTEFSQIKIGKNASRRIASHRLASHRIASHRIECTDECPDECPDECTDECTDGCTGGRTLLSLNKDWRPERVIHAKLSKLSKLSKLGDLPEIEEEGCNNNNEIDRFALRFVSGTSTEIIFTHFSSPAFRPFFGRRR
jgi:hypothetical protein